MTTRAAIAAVLTAAEIAVGTKTVTCSEFRPKILSAGVAWPQTTGWDRAEAREFTRNWAVYLILPADEQAAATWLDQNLDALADALLPEVFVDRIEPILIPAESSSLFAALVTGRSE